MFDYTFLVCYLFIKVSVTVVTDDRQTYTTIPDTPATTQYYPHLRTV